MNVAFISFDRRLSDYIEIGSWINHKSAYQIVSFDELPNVVKNAYVKNLLSFTRFKDLYQLTPATQPEKINTNESQMTLFDQLQASLYDDDYWLKISKLYD